MMRKLLTLFVLFCAGWSCIAAEVFVQCRVASPTPIWQGQRVIVEVDALIAEGWVGIKKMNLGEMDGAVVLNRNPAGITISDSVNGKSCSGQRKELWVYPQRGGEIVLPAFTVDVETRTWGANATKQTQQLLVESTSFEADVPNGVPAGTLLVSATTLQASQKWSSEMEAGVVGDAVTRTITITADDLPGMLFPPLTMAEQEGVGVYRKQPLLLDQMDRGELVGKRQEVVTVVFEAPGTYRIPALSFQWFDLKTQTLKTERFEGRTMVISGTPVQQMERSSHPPLLWGAGLVGLIIAGLSVLGRCLYPHIFTDEWLAFRRVRRSVNADPKTVLNAALSWGDQLEPDFVLEAFLQNYGDTTALESLERFYPSVWSGSRDDFAPFIKTMRSARRNYFKQAKALKREARLLPPLNP